MKNFRLIDLDTEREYFEKNAIDIIRKIKFNNIINYEIAWKTPITGNYHTLMVNNIYVTTINKDFELPKVMIKELIK